MLQREKDYRPLLAAIVRMRSACRWSPIEPHSPPGFWAANNMRKRIERQLSKATTYVEESQGQEYWFEILAHREVLRAILAPPDCFATQGEFLNRICQIFLASDEVSVGPLLPIELPSLYQFAMAWVCAELYENYREVLRDYSG